MTAAARGAATYYRIDTGEIVGWGPAPGEDDEMAPGVAWIEGTHDNTFERIDLATRLAVPLRKYDLTIQMNRVAGLPQGVTAFVAGEPPVVVEDGDLTFTVDYEQSVHVTLQCPTYEHATIDVLCSPEFNAVTADIDVTVAQDVTLLRATDYPSIGDQLDAIWKALAALPGNALPDETKDMLSRVQRVKSRFEKKVAR